MYQVLTGTIVISVLHALIPSHWLPIIAIGRKEGWSMNAVMQVTFLSGFAHALSTILIGIFIGYIGIELSIHVEQFTKVIAPGLMIVLGLFFMATSYSLAFSPGNGSYSIKSENYSPIGNCNVFITLF